MVDPTEPQHAHRESELETRDGSLDVSTFRDTMSAAREHFTKALAIHQQAEGPNFADLVSLLVHYAGFERGRGATERTRELGRRAASLAERYEIPLSPESRALIDWAQAG